MSSLGGERKIATMVFADLVGSTELATGLDPEDLRGRLEPFFEAARTALEQHGGTVEKYIGDAVMAVFGAPVAHGDDPDRAIAAGLAVVDQVSSLDGQLAVRVGIETGEVLAMPRAGDLTVTGEAVNAAARLQQAAAPGEVLVGERTARACRRAQLQPNGEVLAKGIDQPIRAFKAMAVEAGAALSAVPLVGRDDDLEMLRLIARRAARERVPQLVTVIGEAGIGKTRLAAELFEELRSQAQGWLTVVGRSPPYGHGISFWALGEILHAVARVPMDASSERVETSIRSMLADLGAEDAAEIAAALMLPMRGGEDEADAEDELKRAWRRFVGMLASERPLAIAVDDAQWADEGTLHLLEEAAFGVQEAPVLILCTGRPELAERRPDFGRAARNNTQLELLPLDSDSARRLAELLLPDEQRSIADRVADAAGGNPFFTEEVSCAVIDDGDEAEHLPDTVQAAVAARMDQLPRDEKRALQLASILGHTFSQRPLGDLLGEDPDELLAALRRKALVRERTARKSGQYAFRHQLIRDVVYQSLPRRERADLHERAAAALLAQESFVERPELVAYHLDHAFELRPTPERRTAACAAVIEAAASAVRRGAVARGQELYEEAAELSEGADRVDSLVAAAEVALRRWRGDHAVRLFRDAGKAAEKTEDPSRAASPYARAVEVGTRMGGISGSPDPAELIPLLERGRELVADDDVVTKARLLLDKAWLAWRGNDADEMEEPAKEGLTLARETDDVALLQSALDANTASDWLHNRHRSAVGHTRERLELLREAPRTGALDVERSDALHMMIESLLQTGDFHEAEEFAREARELDLTRGIIYSAWQRGLLPAFFLGRWDEALKMAERVREAWLAAERPPLGAFATSIACAGAIQGFRGDDGANTWFDIARELSLGGHGNRAGVAFMQADVELHQGLVDCAADRLDAPTDLSWFRSPYLAARAEAFARLGGDGADDAIGLAQTNSGEHRYALGILMRAEGIRSGDGGRLRESFELFKQLDCPYQTARSGWLLGGAARDEATEILERLGATLPAD
jgi:class 3 adenylate cyclase/tetratricopeptide (TPR) repeat protein